MHISQLRELVPLTASAACYAAGYAVGLVAFLWAAHRRRLLTDGIFRLMTAGLLGGLVAANLAQWVFEGGPGKTVLGAVAGGYLAVLVAKRRLGITRPTGDLFAFALSAGEAVGRFGCYFGGCCYGRVCSLPWAIYQHGAYRHPTQLYMAGASAAIFITLLVYERRQPPDNALFYLQGLLYCTSRFVIEFYRVTDIAALGLSWAQIACIAGFVFFTVRLRLLAVSTSHPAANSGVKGDIHGIPVS